MNTELFSSLSRSLELQGWPSSHLNLQDLSSRNSVLNETQMITRQRARGRARSRPRGWRPPGTACGRASRAGSGRRMRRLRDAPRAALRQAAPGRSCVSRSFKVVTIEKLNRKRRLAFKPFTAGPRRRREALPGLRAFLRRRGGRGGGGCLCSCRHAPPLPPREAVSVSGRVPSASLGSRSRPGPPGAPATGRAVCPRGAWGRRLYR